MRASVRTFNFFLMKFECRKLNIVRSRNVWPFFYYSFGLWCCNVPLCSVHARIFSSHRAFTRTMFYFRCALQDKPPSKFYVLNSLMLVLIKSHRFVIRWIWFSLLFRKKYIKESNPETLREKTNNLNHAHRNENENE